MPCWASEPQPSQNQKGLWTGKGKDKLSIWAIWICGQRVSYYHPSILVWSTWQFSISFLFGNFRISGYRLWGSHSRNLCLVICPLTLSICRREGVLREDSICEGPDAWISMVPGEADAMQEWNPEPIWGRGRSQKRRKLTENRSKETSECPC